MLKKYLPYIFLAASALLLFYIKRNQRGSARVKHNVELLDTALTVPAVIPPGGNVAGELDRTGNHLVFSKHAKCRMDCRHIDESEVREILKTGEINFSRIEADEKGRTIPVEGITHDKQHVRIVFAPKKDAVVVVTVIDLETEWSCDCK